MFSRLAIYSRICSKERPMNTNPKIIGIIQTKNAWPVSALSISYALMHHVDEVYVLNHSSTDGTYHGLQLLQKLWNERIHVFHCYESEYWQEALTNTLIGICQKSSPDWIYPFDSDEFLLTKQCGSLKELLINIDSKCDAIRYEVQNWISVEHFCEYTFDHYRLLKYRSVPNLFISQNPRTLIDEILNGNMNYFDVPFSSKIIFRANELAWIACGSHEFISPLNHQIKKMTLDECSVAHFPLLSKNKLKDRIDRSIFFSQQKFSINHGWQSHLLNFIAQKNQIEQFWNHHSISLNKETLSARAPYCHDDSFVQRIDPVLCFLQNSWDELIVQTSPKDDTLLNDTLISYHTASQLVKKFQRIANSINFEYHDLINKHNELISQHKKLITEHQNIMTSRSWRYTNSLRKFIGLLRSLMNA